MNTMDEKGEKGRQAKSAAHSTNRTDHKDESQLNQDNREHDSHRSERRESMEETKHEGIYDGFSRLSESYLSPEGVKKAASWYISTSEKLANQTLDFQAKSIEWAKGTPLYPFVEAQQNFSRKFIEQSASTARTLWRLE